MAAMLHVQTDSPGLRDRKILRGYYDNYTIYIMVKYVNKINSSEQDHGRLKEKSYNKREWKEKDEAK